MPLAGSDVAVASDQPAVVWRPWRCEGDRPPGSGRPCRTLLMELDVRRPAAIKKVCEKCGYQNVWVEAWQPVGE